MMVVLAIMSIALGVAAVTIRDTRPSYVFQQETQRLQAAFSTASDDALLHGRQWGMLMESGEYRFVTLDNKTHQWVEVTDPLLAKHTLPDNLTLKLEATNRMVLPDVSRAAVQPAILLMSSGLTSVFSLRLKDKNDARLAVSFTSDGHSDIVVGEHDAKS